MLIPFDEKTGTVSSAIRVLIGLCRPPDSLRSGESSIDIRTRQREHTRKQKEIAEEQNCLAEVSVLLLHKQNGINFRISGRADLVSEDGNTVLEVKTAKPLPKKPATHHLLQVLFYAKALNASETILVYTDPDTKESVEFTQNIDDEEYKTLWTGFLTDVSVFVKNEWERHKNLKASLANFNFPFKKTRLGQDEIISAVTDVNSNEEELLMQAPTGTGKTAAVLTGAIPPVIKKWKILFFLTSKNTQKKILAETIQKVVDNNFPLRTIILSSRERSCPLDTDRCNPEICPYAEVFEPRIRESGVIDRLTENILITPEKLMEEAVAAEVCPFELALFVSQRCDLIACDYNYVFDPGIRLKRFFDDDETAARCALLVDEAANLPERVRGIWSPEIKTSWVETTWKYAAENKKLKKLLRPWRQFMQSFADSPWPYKEDEVKLAEGIIPPIVERRKWQQALAGDMNSPPEAILLSRAVFAFGRVAENMDERFHLLARKEKKDTLIQWFCTDPSVFIKDEHIRCSSISCFSATLEPINHFAKELGLGIDNTLNSKVVGWPFPPENLSVWVDTNINTRWRYREEQTERLIKRMQGARTKTPGTWMVFFPSFAWMEKIVIAAEEAEMDFISQQRVMVEEERKLFVEQINSGDNLVLVVSGGLFAEGVDLTIPDLQGCFIIGPSLPSVSLKQKLLQERYNSTGRDGFLHAFAIPGINRVIQAAGRLIRNSEQKANLVLVGERFTKTPYINHLPEHWFPLKVIRNGRVSLKKQGY